MSKKNKKNDDLDTETTFAEMNVEGFKWYDPSQKQDNSIKHVKHQVSRKEYWRMVRAAFVAFIPYFFMLLFGVGIIIGILYLWLS